MPEVFPVGEGRIFAVVLAAGKSERFGNSNKLLTRLPEGRTLLERVFDSVSGEVAGVIIVTNSAIRERVHEVLSGRDTIPEFVVNDEGEMTSSFKKGVMRAKEFGAGAVILLLGDQPFISPETVKAVIAAWRKSGAAIIHPTFSGRPVHPVIFSKELFGQILSITEERTLKDFVRAHAGEAFFFSLDGITSSGREFADIDVPSDL